MRLTVNPVSKLKGIVKAPPSKSYTIRAVIAASLASGSSTIRDPLYSDDTRACIEACRLIGATIAEGNALIVRGCGGRIEKPGKTIDTMNSGTSIRLLTAVAALSSERITLTGDSSIQKRPIGPLLDALKQMGVKTESKNGFPPATVQGPIRGGTCRIRGDISSQFISALLMACPLAEKDTVIELTSPLKSRPYVDLTLDILERFNVRVENEDYRRFIIAGGQEYKETEYTVEGDYSSAAFLLAAAALTESDVTVNNLFKASRQADKKIVNVLDEMGADLEVKSESVRVKGNGKLHGITVDLSDSPDLVPILAAVGALAEGRTVLKNVEHARYKECDRIHAMTVELKKMGSDIEERKDGLVIKGRPLKAPKDALDGWHDHRIVMALAVAGLKAEGETRIGDAEYVSVTFPNFVELMRKLGAHMSVR
ncbi:MAG: 3-phosphoshikimate 1-carboxyvinyltransferase [Candidatus Altiarchaeota archaeon]